MFETKFVEKIKTYFMFNNSPLPQKNLAIYEKMWKYGRARQATDDSIMKMQFACWITKAIIQTHTHDI